VAVIRSIAKKIASASDPPDISDVMDSVSQLLDRSVGAEEYIIRTVGDPGSLFDLATIDFEQLAMRFGDKKRTAANHARRNIEQRIDQAVRQNPTRRNLAERFRRLIDEYNTGTHNIEEFLRRLQAINDELTAEEQRSVREDLTEEELAVFDLLTKPEPELTDKERSQVKRAAQQLLEAISDRLVLDWRRRAQSKAAVQAAIGKALDEALPDAYGPDLFEQKVEAVFGHIYGSYFDDGTSVYETEPVAVATTPAIPVGGLDQLTTEDLQRAVQDPEQAAWLRAQLLGANAVWVTDTTQLLATGDGEGRHVEFKQTARYNVREQRKDKQMEAVVVKTVAGFLNAEGGALLIGVDDDSNPVGLTDDYALVKPPDRDGYINWLDTLLENHLGHAGAHRVQARIDVVDGHDVCRLDVPASSRPIWTTKDNEPVLYERRNNSTRAVPTDDVDSFIANRFG